MALIRQIEEADFPALRVLGMECWQETPDLWPLGLDMEYLEGLVRTLPCFGGFVAEGEDGSLSGLILVQLLRFPYAPVICCALVLFYVLPQARRIVPRQLLRAAEGWARENKAEVFQVTTLGGRYTKRHERFFTGMGYSLSGLAALRRL